MPKRYEHFDIAPLREPASQIDRLEHALAAMAYIVLRHGPQYAPYLDRLEKELEQARQTDERAKRIYANYRSRNSDASPKQLEISRPLLPSPPTPKNTQDSDGKSLRLALAATRGFEPHSSACERKSAKSNALFLFRSFR